MLNQFTLFDQPKRCSKCGEKKPLTEYHRRNTVPNGYKPQCKACQAAYVQENIERITETQRRYNDENREKVRARKNAYNERNRETVRDQHRAYVEKNREHLNELARARAKQNKDKIQENTRRYQARKQGATVAPVSYTAILERFGMVCHICGNEIGSRAMLHMDHVIPLSRGGHHSEDNIRPSHAFCNTRKGARLMEELDRE